MGALRKRCASLWMLRNIAEALWGVAERYGTLRSIA